MPGTTVPPPGSPAECTVEAHHRFGTATARIWKFWVSFGAQGDSEPCCRAPPIGITPGIEIKANPLALSRALEVGSSGPVDPHPPLGNRKHLPYQLPYGALACWI